jgi:hypothetical protein
MRRTGGLKLTLTDNDGGVVDEFPLADYPIIFDALAKACRDEGVDYTEAVIREALKAYENQ